MMMFRLFQVGTVWAFTLLCSHVAAQTVTVFNDAGIQFRGSESFNGGFDIRKSGRIVTRELVLPEFAVGSQLMANLNVFGIEDPWDRAGSIRVTKDGASYELHKFITGFNGTTTHQTDVSSLASILQGEVTIEGFIDTWVERAWTIDFDIEAIAGSIDKPTGWAHSLVSPESWDSENFEDGSKESRSFTMPYGIGGVHLTYFASGHATDGGGGDEFETREHTITIDGKQVASFTPWRSDCEAFREVNPTSGRWPTGNGGEIWSSDFSRSGWCPGDDVEPHVFDVTEFVTPGSEHVVEYLIDGVRAKDDSGKGYWRVSSYLSGIDLSVEIDAIENPDDRVAYVHDVVGTWIGDANLDGQFNSGDFVEVFAAGEYEDDISGNSSWSTGDWNGDKDFNSSDFILAFSDGGYEKGQRAAITVPEPSGIVMVYSLLATLLSGRFLAASRSQKSRRSAGCMSRVDRPSS